MKKHRLRTEPKEVLFRNNSTLIITKVKNVVKHMQFIIPVF